MAGIQKTIPLVAFCLYFIKIAVVGAEYPDAAILFILSAFSAFLEYKNSDKKIIELADQINKRQKELESYIKDIENIKAYVNSSKLSGAIRPMNVNNR